MHTVIGGVRRYPYVAFVVLAAAGYVLLRQSIDVDLFEAMLTWLVAHENVEVDEIIFFAVLGVASFAVDQTRNGRKHRENCARNEARIQAVRSTMATVHDVVNNALNNLHVIRIEAENSRALSPETLELFEGLIADTAAKLREIDELDTFAERTLAPGLSRLELCSEQEEEAGGADLSCPTQAKSAEGKTE